MRHKSYNIDIYGFFAICVSQKGRYVMERKRVIIYSRVSTINKGQKPELQLEALREYCNARGWTVTGEIVDEGWSGTRADRPGIKKLLNLVRKRECDIVLVLKLDRLFRSLKHLIDTLQEFDELGVEFISLKDNIDLTTSAGRLLTHLIAAFAEFEADIIKERTMLGLEHARSKGIILGRPITNNYSEIIALREEGKTYYEIQKALGVSKGAICRALKSRPVIPQKTEILEEIKTNG